MYNPNDISQVRLPKNAELVVIVNTDEHAERAGSNYTFILQTPRHLLWHKRVFTRRMCTRSTLEKTGLQAIVDAMAGDIPEIDDSHLMVHQLQEENDKLKKEVERLQGLI
jgi:hypothetical protein